MEESEINMAKITSEQIEIAAGSIRAEARRKSFKKLNKKDAFDLWDEMARIRPLTITAIVYMEGTENQRNRVLISACKGMK
jgi:hypothetical protein